MSDDFSSIPRDLLKGAKAPPPLSEALRHHLEQIHRKLGPLTEAMLNSLKTDTPNYSDAPPPELSPEIQAMLHEMIRSNVDNWFQMLFEGRAPAERDLAPAVAYARKRFHQGVALPDLLQNFRSGATAVWMVLVRNLQHEPALQSEVFMNLSSFVLLHTDLLGQVLSQSYLAEESRSREWRDRSRQNICSLIFENPENRSRFEALAGEFGIDPNGRRIAIAIRPQGEMLKEVNTHRLEELVSRVKETFSAQRASLFCLRRETVVFWLVADSGYHPLQQEEDLVKHCEALLAAHPELIQATGIGVPAMEATGWKRSAEQSVSAITLALAAGAKAGVHCFSAYVLENSVQAQKRDLEVLETLLSLIQEDAVLIPTLRTWLTTPGLTRKAAAAALGIHPNTLDYRLKKIEQLTGANLSDMSWLARFHVALRMRAPS